MLFGASGTLYRLPDGSNKEGVRGVLCDRVAFLITERLYGLELGGGLR